MDENFDMRVALDHAKYSLEKQFESVDSFKETSKALLGSASLVVAVAGSIQALRGAMPGSTVLFGLFLCVALAAFGVVIFGCMRVISPLTMHLPVKADWDLYQEAFFGKEERDVLKESLSAHLNAIDINKGALETMAVWVKRTAVAFGVSVIGMILLVIV
jgi:hypothetical protein